MIAIEFRFTAGQYHATPWGRHVNEGDVEWPPTPWRVLRALIAVWYQRADTQRYPKETLASLIETLAEHLPVYQLPPAVHTHTRHYLPTKYRDTTLVHDAFARVSSSDKLVMAWPELTLDGDMLALIRHLVEKLTYLGRAESWVAAQLLTDWDGTPNCYPAVFDSTTSNRTHATQGVSLLTPITARDFDEWRGRLPQGGRGQPIPPETLLDALSLSTGDLQKGRWSSPPGAQTVLYLRPEDSLNGYRSVRTAPRANSFNVARFALGGNPSLFPKWTDAVVLGDLLHIALMGTSDNAVAPSISGRDANGEVLAANHRHGFCLPEDADGDGYIDHLLFVSRNDFLESVLKAIYCLNDRQKLWTPERWSGRQREWPIRLELLGHTDRPSSLRAADGEVVPLLEHARVWTSITPYFHPWHAKKHGRFGAEEQIRREISQRGLPEPLEVRVLTTTPINGERPAGGGEAGKCYTVRDFRRRRPSHPGQTAPDKFGSFLTIEFPIPITGPLALGFACHFGLGLFQPKH
ncbi:type I-G CRISPR-associated protein Csb2 [Alicyclobacillus acidoterrestris]|uniref:type I-G CRISPR-associated protein Csb2 n=1 Tax=Alicyclobacillus acidoterrestris TaxID=1450 RepID=UPI003F52DC9A